MVLRKNRPLAGRIAGSVQKEFGPLPVRPEELITDVATFFQANMHELQEVRIVADLLREWAGRVPIAVASNGERKTVEGSRELPGL